MPSHRPSVSFKLPGADAIAVDLLVPGRNLGEPVQVKELGAHAQAIPLLEFLIDDPVDGIILSPNQVVPVKLPSPERFVLHKLYSSQSRKAHRDKIRKDLQQAAVLAAVIEEETPGRLGEAFRKFPASGKAAVKQGAKAVTKILGDLYPEARAVLENIVRK
jgi:hypothetical protein